MLALLGFVALLLPLSAYAAPATHLAAPAVHIATLNAWGHFAELATALGLAYANLPGFRYRDKVREYILRMLRDDGFNHNFRAFCKKHPAAVQDVFSHFVAIPKSWKI